MTEYATYSNVNTFLDLTTGIGVMPAQATVIEFISSASRLIEGYLHSTSLIDTSTSILKRACLEIVRQMVYKWRRETMLSGESGNDGVALDLLSDQVKMLLNQYRM